MKNDVQIASTVKNTVQESSFVDLVNWILAAQKCTTPWTIAVIFVDDAFIAELHEKFMNIAGATDVITFNLTEVVEEPEGEIYISVDTAQKNAVEYNVSLDDELFRLTAHGVYHLLDYDDSTPDLRQEMTILENKALEYIQSTL